MNPYNKPVSGREISRQSYEQILARLPQRRREVLQVLGEHGPATANEISNWLPPTNLCHRNIRSRLTDLVKAGLAVRVAKVTDPISGCPAMQYRALKSGEIPPSPSVELRPRRASRAQLEAENARLRVEIAALKSNLSSKGNLQRRI